MGSLCRGSCGGHIVRTHCLRGRQMFGKTKGPIPAEDRDDVLSVRAAHDAGHDPLANVRDVDHPVLVSLLRLAVHCGVSRLDTVAYFLCSHLLPNLRDFTLLSKKLQEASRIYAKRVSVAAVVWSITFIFINNAIEGRE